VLNKLQRIYRYRMINSFNMPKLDPPPPVWKRLLSVWGRAPVPVYWRMSAKHSPIPRRAPYPWFQALYDRLPDSEMFDGELCGRRLLSVWDLRDPAQTYRYDGEAASFWLQFTGDDKDHQVWVRPDWIVNFFDKTWMLLPRAVVAPAASELAFVRHPHERWSKRPEANALVGLTLSEVQVANIHGYDPQIGALCLHFAKESPPDGRVRTASMHLDWGTDDEMENTLLVISDKHRLSGWSLSEEVQGILESSRGDWSLARQMPMPPWNDEAHWLALTRFRRALQTWLMAWNSTVAATLELPARLVATQALFHLLDKLCAFEIGLGHRNVWQTSGGGWRDADGEDYGEHWLRYADGFTDHSLAQDTWEALKAAWPMLARDRYAHAWQALGLQTQAPGVRHRAEELAPVWSAYQQWWPLLQELLYRGKS